MTRAFVRRIQARAEGGEPRRQPLVVVRDDEGVQPAPARLAGKLPGRHAAVADEGMDVEIRGDDELAIHARRPAGGHAIERCSGEDGGGDQRKAEGTGDGHEAIAPMMRTESRVASSM